MANFEYEWENNFQLNLTISINKNPIELTTCATLHNIDKSDLDIMLKAFKDEVSAWDDFEYIFNMFESFIKDLKVVDSLGFYKNKYKEV